VRRDERVYSAAERVDCAARARAREAKSRVIKIKIRARWRKIRVLMSSRRRGERLPRLRRQPFRGVRSSAAHYYACAAERDDVSDVRREANTPPR